MSHFNNRSQSSARRSDYIWQYEYYDDEEPVSFEGLKAHRYSIVIGFWVGLAVFVIFMFFILALLTKTGAPHQENPESSEKHHQTGSCLVDISAPQDESDKAFFPSYFHFYINEKTRGVGKKKLEENGFGKQSKGPLQGIYSHQRGVTASGTDEAGDVIEEAGRDQPLNGLEFKGDKDRAFFSQFDIPNFVNTSTLGEEDLLYELFVIQAHQSHSWDGHCDIR